MLEQLLLIAGALIFGVLGLIHLIYTFFGSAFAPRDAATRTAMESTSPRLTRETTMWRAWIGFNASHSLGAIVFAVFVLLLALGHMPLLRAAPVFAWVAAANAVAWLWLARRYWFRVPFVGLLLASLCFAIAALRLSL